MQYWAVMLAAVGKICKLTLKERASSADPAQRKLWLREHVIYRYDGASLCSIYILQYVHYCFADVSVRLLPLHKLYCIERAILLMTAQSHVILRYAVVCAALLLC
jgi:hypothetical protein